MKGNEGVQRSASQNKTGYSRLFLAPFIYSLGQVIRFALYVNIKSLILSMACRKLQAGRHLPYNQCCVLADRSLKNATVSEQKST